MAASFEVSKVIARHGKPFSDGDYIIIARHGKPFSDGDYIKESWLECASV